MERELYEEKLGISSFMNLEDIYLSCFCYTSKILEEQGLYKSNFPKNKAIDIRALAKAFDIDIVEMKINRADDVFRYGTPGYLDYYDYQPQKYQWTIFVNKAMGDLTKRYIIAHELGHYFLKYKGDGENVKFCTNPLFPKNQEEQLCDLMASFLLMPIELVLEIMSEYVDSYIGKETIDMYEWLRHLGFQLSVSDYHTVSCFQNVRYLGGLIYEKKGNYVYNGSDRFCKSAYEKMLQFPKLFR